MLNSTGLVVLHTTKFGENSIILHTLSKEYGRRGFLVRNVGRKTAMSLFLPMNIIEGNVVESTRSRLWTLKGISMQYPLMGIRGSVSKNAMTMFISEVLYRVVKDGVVEPGLYEMCERNLLILDAMKADFRNYHIRFLLEFIMQLGFSLDEEVMSPFLGEYSDLMTDFMSSSFSESMLIPMSGKQRNEIAERLLRYIEYHTESSVNVNSLSVLRELFQDSAQI